jgi:anti-sigma factor RsiW
MNCRECTDFLADYIAGELAADARATFDAHLDACPNCRVFLVQYQETIVLEQKAMSEPDTDEGIELPPDLVRAILKALNKPDA